LPKKEEEVKVEATTVPIGPDLPPFEPYILSAGKIAPGYEHEELRAELLDWHVRKESVDNEGLRPDYLTQVAKYFIDGNIDGLFNVYVYALDTMR